MGLHSLRQDQQGTRFGLLWMRKLSINQLGTSKLPVAGSVCEASSRDATEMRPADVGNGTKSHETPSPLRLGLVPLGPGCSAEQEGQSATSSPVLSYL